MYFKPLPASCRSPASVAADLLPCRAFIPNLTQSAVMPKVSAVIQRFLPVIPQPGSVLPIRRPTLSFRTSPCQAESPPAKPDLPHCHFELLPLSF